MNVIQFLDVFHEILVVLADAIELQYFLHCLDWHVGAVVVASDEIA